MKVTLSLDHVCAELETLEVEYKMVGYRCCVIGV